MRWTYHDHIVGTLCAVGLRGEYSVQCVGMEWVLQGVGHDGLSMLAIPPAGKRFARLDGAQTWAEALDRVKNVEPQASGG